MSKPLKVYAEKNHADEKYWLRYLINPIKAYWGDGTVDWPCWEENFRYYKKNFIIEDKLENADVVFLPLTLNYYIINKKINIVDDLVARAKEKNKTTFVWVDGDYQANYNKIGCVLLKYSGFQSKSKQKHLIIPGDMKYDLLKKYYDGKITVSQKEKYPKIGFVGLADYTLAKSILMILKNSFNKYIFNDSILELDQIIPYPIHRRSILKRIEKSNKIKSEFIYRKNFAVGIDNNNSKQRMEFIKNIINNNYTICMRGSGNYSIRFYETLCLGRIPLFINTDCILPFENEINWKEICIWVENYEIPYIIEKIHDAHHSMTKNQFIEKQIYCRELWLKYLSKEGFYTQFHNFIEKYHIK